MTDQRLAELRQRAKQSNFPPDLQAIANEALDALELAKSLCDDGTEIAAGMKGDMDVFSSVGVATNACDGFQALQDIFKKVNG